MLSPAYPKGLLHEVLAGHDPDRVALRFLGPTTSELTYGELDRRSNQLAHVLNQLGIGPGRLVGLLLGRGPHLAVAQLAVMTAGAAWTILDPLHPTDRLDFQADDAAAALVLTTTDLAQQAPARMPHWCLDDPEIRTTMDGYPATRPDVDVRPTDAAYLLYTSGSTGTPKGILVSHRSAFGFCYHATRHYAMSPADRVAQTANPAFDFSIFDCFATWLAGSTLISAPRTTFADPDAFGALLIDERVTLSTISPALLALLDPERLAGGALRAIVSAGEALPPELAARWSRPGLALHNAYGPTETTVVVTDYLCPGGASTGPTPIGTALPDHRVYVLDAALRPAPIGVPGQLYIAGAGVTYGYHRRPGLTAQRFLPDPYDDRPGQRMYATGDRVRWRSDGVLEYLGRLDRQVKLRGLRIELGEIEHALTQHPDVRQCAVVLRDNSYLAAYLVGDPDLGEIRMHLAQRLPGYMLPSAYVALSSLPLTPSGKLDTARLPDPGPRAAVYRQPRTDTERWLADTWLDLLGVERIGAGDTLFDLGANSLHTIQLTTRVRYRFNVELDPRDLFANPTLEQLAARIDETATTIADDLAEIAELERMLAQKRAEKARQARL